MDDSRARQELSLFEQPSMKPTYDSVIIELRRLCQDGAMRKYAAPILQDLDEGWLVLDERVKRLENAA